MKEGVETFEVPTIGGEFIINHILMIFSLAIRKSVAIRPRPRRCCQYVLSDNRRTSLVAVAVSGYVMRFEDREVR